LRLGNLAFIRWDRGAVGQRTNTVSQ
jgi:hypothetical protein